MAIIFLSYSIQRHGRLAQELELQLRSKRHTFRIRAGAPPAGKWRARLMNALLASDAMVALLSNDGVHSNSVLSEIGSARVCAETRGMLLLPVVVGEPFSIPGFVSDYQCFHLPGRDPHAVDKLAETLDEAIVANVEETQIFPRIFLSHRHEDEGIVRALVSLLEAAFEIEKEDLRCTSVHPYTLSPGDRTSERLRAEIAHAELVLGVLSPDVSESKYVLAELGASWGRDVPTFPLLVRGASYEDVPEPLNERHSISLEKKRTVASSSRR